MRKFIRTITATSLLALSVPAMALTASQSVEKEIVKTQTDGTQTVSYVKADEVLPGEKIRYRLDIENDGMEPVTDLVLTMPVPSEVTYVEGSAIKNGAAVTYSADGGNSFVPRSELTMIVGGEPRVVMADDITHIRWKVAGPIDAGSTDALTFKGVLK